MSTTLHVHLSIDGEPLAEIPFGSDRLQVGRLEENDIVVRDRAASRTHALLEREGDQVYVEDLGSQNGIWLGGQRIEGRRLIGPGDELRIGRHTLWVGPPGAKSPGAEGQSTGESSPGLLDAGTSSATAVEASTALASVDVGWQDSEEGADVDPFSIGDEDLLEASEPWDACAAGLGDLGPILDSGEPETELQQDSGSEEVPGSSFPGLIVQRSGQLDRILAWDEDEMCAGRGAECEIFLGAREISRRHALFVRCDDAYEIRDLDSINGVFVNGERVHQRVLCVGDVVQIETFELTFVLESEPIGCEIQTGEDLLDPKVAHTDQLSMTVQGQQPLVQADPDPPGLEAAVPDADEKELELAPQSFEEPAAAPLVLQLELAPQQLPEPLRRALDEMEDVELTVRLKLKPS
ncbi:MAG: FHA domain-containing protein [bacterium]|nr:FHA domain-containing protein [bacterium]